MQRLSSVLRFAVAPAKSSRSFVSEKTGENALWNSGGNRKNDKNSSGIPIENDTIKPDVEVPGSKVDKVKQSYKADASPASDKDLVGEVEKRQHQKLGKTPYNNAELQEAREYSGSPNRRTPSDKDFNEKSK